MSVFIYSLIYAIYFLLAIGAIIFVSRFIAGKLGKNKVLWSWLPAIFFVLIVGLAWLGVKFSWEKEYQDGYLYTIKSQDGSKKVNYKIPGRYITIVPGVGLGGERGFVLRVNYPEMEVAKSHQQEDSELRIQVNRMLATNKNIDPLNIMTVPDFGSMKLYKNFMRYDGLAKGSYYLIPKNNSGSVYLISCHKMCTINAITKDGVRLEISGEIQAIEENWKPISVAVENFINHFSVE